MKDVNGKDVKLGDKVIMNCLRNKGQIGTITGFTGKNKDQATVSYGGDFIAYDGSTWPDYIWAKSEMFELVPNQ